MDNRYGIMEDGIIINICIGQPDNCVSVHLSGNLADAHKGDKIKDGEIVRPEPTKLSMWQADVKENREQIAKNLKNFPYFIRKGWSVDDLNIEFNELHDEYEDLKQEAPAGWTIDKEGYAVRK